MHLARRLQPPFLALVLIGFTSAAGAEVRFLNPLDGAFFPVEPCPSLTCFTDVSFSLQVTSDSALREVHLELTRDGEFSPPRSLCLDQPFPTGEDTICPDTGFETFAGVLALSGGTWQMTAVAVSDGGTETATVTVTVQGVTGPFPGPVRLDSVGPLEAAPTIVLLDDPERTTEPDLVTILGDNLASNQFLEAYLVPVPPVDEDLRPDSGLPIPGGWCLYPAEIVEQGMHGSSQEFLRVRMPKLPERTPTDCSAGAPGFTASIFEIRWRWVIVDPFDRDERIRPSEAIPDPRVPLPSRGPYFRVVKPPYPLIDGFGFENDGGPPDFDEFTAVYGNNAYYCLFDVFGVCLGRILNPLYLLWYPVHYQWIKESSGSCVGMSATSLLVHREVLQLEDFDPGLHYPAGVLGHQRATWDGHPLGIGFGPSRPRNVWATIRMNHGVQVSAQYLRRGLEELHRPNHVTPSLGGSPVTAAAQLEASPRSHVLCITNTGGGHCITPYDVTEDPGSGQTQVHIYDNNDPLQTDHVILVDPTEDRYRYPLRDRAPNNGTGMLTFPLSLFTNQRTMPAIDPATIHDVFTTLFAAFVFGDADAQIRSAAGGRLGWLPDGTFVDELPGSTAIPVLGPPEETVRQMAMFTPAEAGTEVDVNVRGEDYLVHVGQGGHLFQLEVAGASAGETDRVGLETRGDALRGIRYAPESDVGAVVPKAGVVVGDQQSAVARWLGLHVPAGKHAGFFADGPSRSFELHNGTGAPSHYTMGLDMADGPTGTAARVIYGPFSIPPGARHRLTADRWPDNEDVLSQIDLDGDGGFERSERARGRRVAPSPTSSASADLVVTKTADLDAAEIGDELSYEVRVRNDGPDEAHDVSIVDTLPAGTELVSTGGLDHCTIGVSEVVCGIGALAVGDEATLSVVVRVLTPGTKANVAIATSGSHDPDATGDFALAETQVGARVDIRPGSPRNLVNARARGAVPVAILGTADFDVRTVASATLRFGPAGTPTLHGGHLEDVDADGITDLLSHFEPSASGLEAGDSVACVTGSSVDGLSFRGCDRVEVKP